MSIRSWPMTVRPILLRQCAGISVTTGCLLTVIEDSTSPAASPRGLKVWRNFQFREWLGAVSNCLQVVSDGLIGETGRCAVIGVAPIDARRRLELSRSEGCVLWLLVLDAERAFHPCNVSTKRDK